MRNLYYVAIEGTIGVGKTSLANLLSEKLGAKLVLESFEGNPFLSDFYDDPERHAFQTQLWFLLQRYQQQQELRQIDMFQNTLITNQILGDQSGNLYIGSSGGFGQVALDSQLQLNS